MKLHQAAAPGRNLITAYETGRIRINQDYFSGNLIITPDSIVPWQADSFESLSPADFEALLAFEPEVVLFGSGEKLRFPHPRLSAALAEARIGMEVMDTQAACRSFNILMAEDRRVVMAVLG
ncbi:MULTISPECIES: Mth938-like domain-containing protein [unclassified Paludibacterium]|uniref:Mth938-like domain-containing protein n=1 Tax=unclassified Paludibacterium TaxID=2618429 RepID=UPI001C05DCF8|nr:Mth938-like domain-containing protein [Paludibacterium sp. B53371]BEV72033.1 Mth938-like domain-containing protein [Paludibacterium sp. THUN1379]